MKTSLIKIIVFVLLAGFIATGCERRYYMAKEHQSREHHRDHHDNNHQGDDHHDRD